MPNVPTTPTQHPPELIQDASPPPLSRAFAFFITEQARSAREIASTVCNSPLKCSRAFRLLFVMSIASKKKISANRCLPCARRWKMRLPWQTKTRPGFPISLDMDRIDPEDAPGVGTPVWGGATYRESHLAMEIMIAAACRALESWKSPSHRRTQLTADVAVELVLSALAKKILQVILKQLRA